MNQRAKIDHVNEITGLFVIIVILAVIATIVGMAYAQRWFRYAVPLQIVMPPSGAGGIQNGSPVQFLGTNVGSVDDVGLDPNGRMIATTAVRSDFFPFLRTHSYAVLRKTLGIAGQSYLDIERGTGPPLPKENATIVCKQATGGIEGTLEELRTAAVPVLHKISQGVDAYVAVGLHLDGTLTQVDQILTSVDQIIAGIEQGKGTAGQLVADPNIANDLKTILGKVSIAADKLQGVLKELQTTGTHASAATKTLAEDLPGLLLQVQQTAQELERLIKGIEGVWPISGSVPRSPSDTRIPPSEVAP